MKLLKIISTLAILIVLAVTISAVSALASQDSKRVYFIQSDSGILKAIYGIRHNFDNGFTAELTEGQLKALEELSSMLGINIEEVPLYYVLAGRKPPKDTNATRQYFPADQTPWGIEKIYNDVNLNGTTGGLGIDVAVLDTGVYKSHLDLKNRVKQCKDFTKGLTIKEGCSDNNGHGTHVAGTILADGSSDGKGIYGIAPQANLFAYKVCGNDGSCWADDIASAIYYAVDNGAEIISMSLGGGTSSSLIQNAVDYAASNSLIIAAAGNDGPADGSIDYPATYANVVAVGAIDINEQVPIWSSRGVNDGDYIIETREVEFGAPGVSVESTWNNGGYNTISGTSMATPHVSGLAAKFWQGSPSATRVYLQNKSRDIWTIGDDTATGFGLPSI